MRADCSSCTSDSGALAHSRSLAFVSAAASLRAASADASSANRANPHPRFALSVRCERLGLHGPVMMTAAAIQSASWRAAWSLSPTDCGAGVAVARAACKATSDVRESSAAPGSVSSASVTP